ncbi:uncharacterized protein LOC132718143 [Ruditapes philippinarum]|uniref:uncharacterized protein LOC132718143 n=1 Tax=Ruditapes philippinarum TaxID=129788 RepID=UPI00295BEDF5|nr:uncharacterized protein LOC132718143 [Ruditapes philippinarum]
MVEVSVHDNRGVANSTFKDILISPNNDDVIIPISTTFDKAVLHIGIGNGCGIFIEKFGMKNGKELKTSVKYATRKFTDARQQRRNKGKDRKASKSEDIEKIVDESGEKFMRDIPSMKKKDRQMARLFDHLLAQAPTENKSGIDTISDTKPLKESKSVDTESDIGATDESIQSIIGTVLTSDIKNDVHGKHMNDKEIARITAPSFDNQILVGPNMNIHFYKLNETRFNAERTTSFEAIDKAYQEEMLQISFEKEAGAYKPNHIRPSNETGFPLEDDMHIYLDEIFVISKRGTQMFDEFVSATKEMRTNDKRPEDVPGSESTSAIVDIDKGNTEENSNLFGVVLGPISCDTFVDRAADNDSDTLDDIGPDTFGDFLDKESDDSMSKEKGDRQMAWLFDHLLVQAPTENKSGIDTISDTKPLKESKSVDTESDISVTDESIQTIIGTVLTSDMWNDVHGKPMNDKEIARITAPSFDNQILVGPNMNTHLYKLNETRFNAEGTTSFEDIGKAYQEEMLQITFEKEAGVSKPNHIRPSNETGFPLEDDMHIYLDEIFVISKRGTQMFDEFVSATKEMRTNDKRLEDVPESESTSAIVDIDKGNTEENSNLFGVVLGPISCDTFVDRAADNDSDTLDDIGPDTFGDFLDKESDDSMSKEKGDRQMAWLFDHLLAQAPTENKSGIDTISDTKPLKESKSVDTESDISVTDESIQSIIGTVLTSDIRNDVQGKPMNDKEIARITAPSFDNQILVGPNMNIHFYKLNETRFNAEGTTSFEAIDKAYQEEMLQISFEKEAGVYKPNHIRPSNETGFPLEDDMHIYLDEIFVISKRGTQMFDEFVSATKEMRTNDKRLEDVPESESTSAIVDIDKGNTEENSNLFGVVLGPISCDTFVDRAADYDSDTLDDIGPDTFGDFLDKESDDSMSKEKGDRQMAWLFDHLLAQAPTENKSGIDTISDTKPLKESKSVDTESDIGATDESIQSIIGTVLTSDMKNDVHGKHMNDKEIARITAPSFDNQILVGPNINTHLYKLNETRLNAEGTTSFEDIGKAYQEEMLQITFEKEAGVSKPNHIRPSNETGFPLEDDMHIYLDEIFVISKRGTQMFDEFVSATKEMRTKDKQLEDVPESKPTSAFVDIDTGNTDEDSNFLGDVFDKDQRGPIPCDTFIDRAADNDSDTLDDIGPDTFGDFLDKESDDSMSKEKGAVDETSERLTKQKDNTSISRAL